MLDIIRKTIAEHRLICPGDHITVALSGGRDSMALAAALQMLVKDFGFTVSALHIHHGLRAASDDELLFVTKWCEAHGLPLITRHLHLKNASEETARIARYKVFSEYISDGRKIATAHHLSDCAETFLINLSRGCGLDGLCSIPVQRDGIIRPMLDVPPKKIDRFVAQNNIPFVTDESNADTTYLRNFLRHNVLAPMTERRDVDFYHNFSVTLQNIKEERSALDEMSRPYFDEHRTDVLTALPTAVLWRVLRHQCPELTRERFMTLAARLNEKNAKEQIEGELFGVIENGLLFFRRLTPILPQKLQNGVLFANKTICLQEIHSQFTHFDIDCATIKSDLYIRPRQSGDTFCHPTRGWTKSIKKMFSDDHVTDRDRRFVVTDADGNILYVEGYGAAAGFAAGADTEKAIRVIIKIKENETNEKPIADAGKRCQKSTAVQ